MKKKQTNYISLLKQASSSYLDILSKIEDNNRLSLKTKKKAISIVKETNIHTQIVLETIEI